jgi:hypothetical protein
VVAIFQISTKCIGELRLAGCAAFGFEDQWRADKDAPPAPGAGLFLWGGDRRVGACASGDELVSLGFRVGNPSAIGWHQRRIFQHPCYRRRYPDNEQRIATRSLRRKMATSPSRAGGRRTRQLTGRGRNHPPRRGSFFLIAFRGQRYWASGSGNA